VPQYRVAQQEVAEFSRRHFGGRLAHHSNLMSVFTNAQIETRYFVSPLQWFAESHHSLKERNDLHIATAHAMSCAAARQALERAALSPRDVDYVVFVSTTGMATPSLDALLIDALDMGRHTRRTPVWGLGCAGGVAGLARAAEFTCAYPDKVALLVTVETCSTTFQFTDFSKKNFVATALFADGAAAAVIAGRDRLPSPTATCHLQTCPLPPCHLQFVGSYSTLFPNSRHVMGWDVIDTGLSVVFAPEIPARVARDMRAEIEQLMAQHGLTLRDARHFALHPGGARVLDAYMEGIGLQPEDLTHSWVVLRDYGNMSSPTVLFVLERLLADEARRINPGEYVIMGALGPGFSSELALLRG
jgi:alkylresorcinol/alkylpyrone synthase